MLHNIIDLISHIHLKTWTKTSPFFCFVGSFSALWHCACSLSSIPAWKLRICSLNPWVPTANSGVSTRQAAMQETCLQQTGYYYIEAPPGTYFVETFNFLWLSLQSSHFDRCCDAFFEGYNYFDVHLDNNLKNLNQLYRVALESALPIYQFNWTLRILRGVRMTMGVDSRNTNKSRILLFLEMRHVWGNNIDLDFHWCRPERFQHGHFDTFWPCVWYILCDATKRVLKLESFDRYGFSCSFRGWRWLFQYTNFEVWVRTFPWDLRQLSCESCAKQHLHLGAYLGLIA